MLDVESNEDLAEGSRSSALRLIRAVADDRVALCTHGDVMIELLVALADEDRLDLGSHPRNAKGGAWVLEANKGRFRKATYLAPRS